MSTPNREEDFLLIAMSGALIAGSIITVLYSSWWGTVVMLVSPVLYIINLGRLVRFYITRQETAGFARQLMMPGVFFWFVGIFFLPQLGRHYYFGFHIFQLWVGLFAILFLFLIKCSRLSYH